MEEGGRVRRLAAVAALAFACAAAAADPAEERARSIVSGRCFLCHGASGESASEAFARLAGQQPRYLEKQLRDFRDGRRRGGGMEAMVAGLSDGDIAALAAFFSRQKAEPFPASDRVLASLGRSIYELGKPNERVEACRRCHGAEAKGEGEVPRLAGQQPKYLMQQLKNFARGNRGRDIEAMHQVAGRLADVEIRALAEFLGELP